MARKDADGGNKKPKGDLYGDQYVFVRDLSPNNSYDDATPGDGDGEIILDGNGNPILLGSDGLPIYYELDTDGKFVLDPDRAAFAETVELGRANVARAPEKVISKSLKDALKKVDKAVDVDAAGRIVYDTGKLDENGDPILATIDSPKENIALYRYLMTADGVSSWPQVKDHWPTAFKNLIKNDPDFENWDPSSLLGAAFDKAAPISLDAVLTENTLLGINTVTTQLNNLGRPIVDYFEFNNGSNETYNHSRETKYGDTWVTWLADEDGNGTYEYVEPVTVYEAVFGGMEWVDQNPDGGADDFAKAVDDARAVISFMHDQLGAKEVEAPANSNFTSLAAIEDAAFSVEDSFAFQQPAQIELVNGTNKADTLTFVGEGSQHILALKGADFVDAGGAPDIVEGGNGNDTILGGGGPDELYGGKGNDIIDGGGGPDTIDGGQGDDILNGGAAFDILAGGKGKDTFVFSTHSDDEHSEGAVQALEHEGQTEIITDFKHGHDKIDFSQLEGVNAFSLDAAAYSVWAEQDQTNTIVYVDTDGNVAGDNPAELMVTLFDVQATSLNAGDFLL